MRGGAYLEAGEWGGATCCEGGWGRPVQVCRVWKQIVDDAPHRSLVHCLLSRQSHPGLPPLVCRSAWGSGLSEGRGSNCAHLWTLSVHLRADAE